MNSLASAINQYPFNSLKGTWLNNLSRQSCLRHCLYSFFPKHDFLSKFHLKNYLANGSFANVYDIYHMTTFNPGQPQRASDWLSQFANRVSKLHISKASYQEMEKLSENSDDCAKYVQSELRERHKNHLIIIMLLAFIISIIIPNTPIDAFGDFLGSVGLTIFQSIINFCVTRIRTFIDPALIGRALINLVIDIPVYYYYKRYLNN